MTSGGWMAARPAAVLEMIAISRAAIGPSRVKFVNSSRCGLQLSSVAPTRLIERSGRHHAGPVRGWDPHSASQTTSMWTRTEGARQGRVIDRPINAWEATIKRWKSSIACPACHRPVRPSRLQIPGRARVRLRKPGNGVRSLAIRISRSGGRFATRSGTDLTKTAE